MKSLHVLPLFLMLGQLIWTNVHAATRPEIVSFTSGKHGYSGYLFKPAGDGPFPAVMWNHGHAKNLLQAGSFSEYDGLARLYNDAGYVLFLPDRHMSGIADDEYSEELQEILKNKKSSYNDRQQRRYVEYMEINARDIEAALRWLKTQPFVDPNRIAMSGWSSGATAGLLTAEKDLGVRAYVPFSVGATRWKGNEMMHDRLRETVRNAKAPVFLIHAANDSTLVPSELLGPELLKKGNRNKVYVYPFDGKSEFQNGSLAIVGPGIWGKDVLKFLDEAMKN